MSHLESIQRGIDHIEENLAELEELRDVSRAAAMSHYHFQRTFKALTGVTLLQYVRGRRLDLALRLLEETELRVLDVAMEAGYGSQESFARAFKRAFGLSPSAFRERGRATTILPIRGLDRDGLVYRSQQASLLPELEDRPMMHFVGVCTAYDGSARQRNTLGADLSELWYDFLPHISCIEDIMPGPYFGLVRPAVSGEALEYVAAVRVEQGAVVPPEGMVQVSLPASTWAVFTHRGYPAQLDETVDYIYGAWFLNTLHGHRGLPDLEIYGPEWEVGSPHSLVHYAVALS